MNRTNRPVRLTRSLDQNSPWPRPKENLQWGQSCPGGWGRLQEPRVHFSSMNPHPFRVGQPSHLCRSAHTEKTPCIGNAALLLFLGCANRQRVPTPCNFLIDGHSILILSVPTTPKSQPSCAVLLSDDVAAATRGWEFSSSKPQSRACS